MASFDAIIIGAGAAGLMCAAQAGQRDKRVLLLDHADEVGKKIFISGGGRCNFTNLHAAPEKFISANPHFCKSALKGYTQHDFIGLVKKHGLGFHEKTLGQLFCNGSSREMIRLLLAECDAGKVTIKTNSPIADVSRAELYRVSVGNDVYEAPALVLATGGLSIPKMGATDFTYRMAQQFGLSLVAPRPALVPFTFEGEMLALMSRLSGVSLDITARCGKAVFREAMVFTHRGLSGPAILQISSYWQEGQAIALDLLPDLNAEEFLLERKKSRAKAELKTILGEVLPQRLAQALTETFFGNGHMADLPDKKLREVAGLLKNWQLTPNDTEGYAKAEVTAGGVDTAQLSSKTMMAEKVPGLYIIGEAVDVTGWLGGYNFQWAWSSAVAAAKGLILGLSA